MSLTPEQVQALIDQAAEKKRGRRRRQGAGEPSPLEERFALEFAQRFPHLPPPQRQLAGVIPGRRFVFDFAWPDARLLVEVDGGTWSQGRHTRGDGYESDCFKCNAATIAGWRVLRFTAAQVKRGAAANACAAILEPKP